MPFTTFTGTFTGRVGGRPHLDPFMTFTAGQVSRSTDLHSDLHDLHAATTFTRTPLSRGVREGVGSFTATQQETAKATRIRGGTPANLPAPKLQHSTIRRAHAPTRTREKSTPQEGRKHTMFDPDSEIEMAKALTRLADLTDHRFRLDFDRHVARLARWLVDDLRSGAVGIEGVVYWLEVALWAKHAAPLGSPTPAQYYESDDPGELLYSYAVDYAKTRGWLEWLEGEESYRLTEHGRDLGSTR